MIAVSVSAPPLRVHPAAPADRAAAALILRRLGVVRQSSMRKYQLAGSGLPRTPGGPTGTTVHCLAPWQSPAEAPLPVKHPLGSALPNRAALSCGHCGPSCDKSAYACEVFAPSRQMAALGPASYVTAGRVSMKSPSVADWSFEVARGNPLASIDLGRQGWSGHEQRSSQQSPQRGVHRAEFATGSLSL